MRFGAEHMQIYVGIIRFTDTISKDTVNHVQWQLIQACHSYVTHSVYTFLFTSGSRYVESEDS